jgi:hypothetical protein
VAGGLWALSQGDQATVEAMTQILAEENLRDL